MKNKKGAEWKDAVWTAQTDKVLAEPTSPQRINSS